MRKTTFLYLAWLLICMYSTTEAEGNVTSGLALNISNSSTSGSQNKAHHQRKKRQEGYYQESPNVYDYDYPELGASYPGYNPNYSEKGSNYLVPVGIAGGTSLALKATKTKLKLKGLKLLTIPAGIALLGGIAALASGIIPPTAIGGINLPFQGKRRKRDVDGNMKFILPDIYPRRKRFNILRNKLFR